MSQTTQAIESIKKILKQKGMTYGVLAEKLSMSEANVKRMFSQKSMTLDRLEDICNALDVTFVQIARATAAAANQKTDELTIEQEKILAKDMSLFAVFWSVLHGESYESLRNIFNLSEAQIIGALSKLEKIGLIELLPKNKVVVLVSKQIKWRPGGPIRQLYEGAVKTEFLNDDFNEEEDELHFVACGVTEATYKVILRKLKRLRNEIDELIELEHIDKGEEQIPLGLLLAMRNWNANIFEPLVKKKK